MAGNMWLPSFGSSLLEVREEIRKGLREESGRWEEQDPGR